MGVSEGERKQAAENLRRYARSDLHGKTVLSALKDALGFNDASKGWRAVFERLADLICPEGGEE